MRHVADVTSYSQLHAEMRRRLSSLGLTREDVGALAGVPDGYAGKVFAPYPIRKIGIDLWVVFAEAAGLRLVLVEDEAAMRRLVAFRGDPDLMRKRLRHLPDEILEPRAMVQQVLREHLRKVCARGGRNSGVSRRQKMTAAARSRSARHAARARWKRERQKRKAQRRVSKTRGAAPPPVQ